MEIFYNQIWSKQSAGHAYTCSNRDTGHMIILAGSIHLSKRERSAGAGGFRLGSDGGGEAESLEHGLVNKSGCRSCNRGLCLTVTVRAPPSTTRAAPHDLRLCRWSAMAFYSLHCLRYTAFKSGPWSSGLRTTRANARASNYSRRIFDSDDPGRPCNRNRRRQLDGDIDETRRR